MVFLMREKGREGLKQHEKPISPEWLSNQLGSVMEGTKIYKEESRK